MPRDHQRSKVYRAEHVALGRPEDFSSAKDVQKYVNRITRSRFWKHAGGRPFVRVKEVPNKQNARGWMEMIEVPPWAFSKPVILHELAHSLAYCIDMHEPDHGGLFVLIFRRLIELELGMESRQTFDRFAELEGVSWIPRNISPNFDIGG